jgi:hypothetical protein
MYTIYPSMLAAQQANLAAAAVAGYDLITTIYAFECIKHPTDGRAVLVDSSGPFTYEDMVAEGFISPPEEPAEE